METVSLCCDTIPIKSPDSCKELHVLAVDDSNVDRKVIEKLLQISSFKGTVYDFQALSRFEHFHIQLSRFLIFECLWCVCSYSC